MVSELPGRRGGRGRRGSRCVPGVPGAVQKPGAGRGGCSGAGATGVAPCANGLGGSPGGAERHAREVVMVEEKEWLAARRREVGACLSYARSVEVWPPCCDGE